MAELSKQEVEEKVLKKFNDSLLDFGAYLFSKEREQDLNRVIYPNNNMKLERFTKVTPMDLQNWRRRIQKQLEEELTTAS